MFAIPSGGRGGFAGDRIPDQPPEIDVPRAVANCLFCGEALSSLARLTGRQFCSEEHEARAGASSEEWAVNRILEGGGAQQPPTSMRVRLGRPALQVLKGVARVSAWNLAAAKGFQASMGEVQLPPAKPVMARLAPRRFPDCLVMPQPGAAGVAEGSSEWKSVPQTLALPRRRVMAVRPAFRGPAGAAGILPRPEQPSRFSGRWMPLRFKAVSIQLKLAPDSGRPGRAASAETGED